MIIKVVRNAIRRAGTEPTERPFSSQAKSNATRGMERRRRPSVYTQAFSCQDPGLHHWNFSSPLPLLGEPMIDAKYSIVLRDPEWSK